MGLKGQKLSFSQGQKCDWRCDCYMAVVVEMIIEIKKKQYFYRKKPQKNLKPKNLIIG